MIGPLSEAWHDEMRRLREDQPKAVTGVRGRVAPRVWPDRRPSDPDVIDQRNRRTR